MYSTGVSEGETAALFNIPSRETVRRWKQKYEQIGDKGLESAPKGRKPLMKSNNKPIQEAFINSDVSKLLKENQRLQMENATKKNCMP